MRISFLWKVKYTPKPGALGSPDSLETAERVVEDTVEDVVALVRSEHPMADFRKIRCVGEVWCVGDRARSADFENCLELTEEIEADEHEMGIDPVQRGFDPDDNEVARYWLVDGWPVGSRTVEQGGSDEEAPD